jgi:phytoene dehydrogenase-like protein
MHIGPSLEYLERAYDDAKYGGASEQPILEMTMATSVDRTIAPPGKHLLSIFVQYAPYKLSPDAVDLTGGQPPAPPGVDIASVSTPPAEPGAATWDAMKEQFADRCIDVLAEYAPNVPAAIEHRQVLSPVDLERTFGITGGNIMQGAMSAHQLFCFRPVAGWADHRTPIRGLYLCGAASHPGGGVLGACGKNAAEEILRDH